MKSSKKIKGSINYKRKLNPAYEPNWENTNSKEPTEKEKTIDNTKILTNKFHRSEIVEFIRVDIGPNRKERRHSEKLAEKITKLKKKEVPKTEIVKKEYWEKRKKTEAKIKKLTERNIIRGLTRKQYKSVKKRNNNNMLKK